MKTASIFMIALIVSFQVFSQQLNYDWHFAAGGVGPDEVLGSTIDQNGNSILVGFFEDSIVVEGITYRANEFATDGFILKLSPEGQLLWIKELNAETFDDVFPFDVTTDQDDNILVAGSFRGTIDADPSEEEFVLTSDLDDIYLSKLDPDGNLIWAQDIRANNSEERILDIQMAEDGMLYLGGYIDITPNHDNDVPFLMKFNPDDTSIVWNYAAATKGRVDGINEVTVDGDHVYMVGSFEGESLFSTEPTNEMKLDAGSGKDMFVVKLTKDREVLWAINIGSSGESDDIVGRSIEIDSKGDLYIAGDYEGLVDFDPADGVAELDASARSFLLKLTNEGVFQWVLDHDRFFGRKVIVNGSDQPFAVFEGGGSGSTGLVEINKASSNGDSIWTNSVETESRFGIRVREVLFNEDESIFVALNFSSELKYDPNSDDVIQPVDDANDLIYIKFNQDAISPAGTLWQDPSNVFPNPVSNQLNIEFGQFQGKVDIQILDLLGRNIYQQEFQNVDNVQIPFIYPPGHYYIKYLVQGQEVVQKIQKL